MIAIIVAEARNHVIGSKNDLPWYLPADLKHFKDITTGNTVIMGRKTYESIANRLHAALPNRHSIVVSSSLTAAPEGYELAGSLPDALALAHKQTGDTYIIGGASLFNESLENDIVDTVFLTSIDADIQGDTYFVALDPAQWEETAREEHQSDEKNAHNYTFSTLRRVENGNQ